MEFLFIVGPARSGTTLLASLLDDHPDILVWPFEWYFFTNFWHGVPGKGRKALYDLNQKAEKMFNRFSKKIFNTTYSSIDLKETIDSELFHDLMCREPNEKLTALEYLRKVGQSYAQAHEGYKDREIRYFAVKTMLYGIDWHDDSFIHSHKMLFTVRDVKKCYQSYKAKFTEKLNESLFSFYKNRLLFDLYRSKYYLDVYKKVKGFLNIHFVQLDELKVSPEVKMKEISDFLGVPFHEKMLCMSFAGRPFEGHFHNKSLNVQRVISKESTYGPLTPFEDYYLTKIDFFSPKARALPQNLPIFKRISLIYNSIFSEVKPLIEGFSRIPNFVIKVLCFFYLLNVDLKLRLIEKKDLAEDRFFEKKRLILKQKKYLIKLKKLMRKYFHGVWYRLSGLLQKDI